MLFEIGTTSEITSIHSSQHLGPPPKSPARTIVRAHLGDHGHTFVPTKPGTTVRDALSKAMKLRKLVPETCAVYRCSDPTKVSKPALTIKSDQDYDSLLIFSIVIIFSHELKLFLS